MKARNESSAVSPIISMDIAFRRLGQLTRMSLWRQAGSLRMSPTQQNLLKLLYRRGEGLSLTQAAGELSISVATASESINALCKKKLIKKLRRGADGRSWVMALTGEGVAVILELDRQPSPLRDGFGALGEAEQRQLYRLIITMVHALEENGKLSRSRTCVRCKLFEPWRRTRSEKPHHCRVLDIALADVDVRMDCSKFEAAEDGCQQAVWAQFTDGAGSGAEKVLP